ncbi:MAG TPA: MBOAT family O-acyltransferase [Gemmatimonadaceae bacterium]|nr:MBOAT family O-acyltransferase [Gemmatimonadaceae bacterium]
MLFNSSAFAVFLVVVLAGHWALTSRRARNLFLLAASYLFYGWWDWRFLLLLIGTSTIDYVAGIAIHDSTDDRRRKTFLWLSCGANLATLVFFKYFNFFSENLQTAFQGIGLHLSMPVLRVILPVGVSFYTLQAMTYTIDVYRRVMPPCRDYPDFLLFVAYFPQLVAGPISKARQLLPQLQAPRRFDAALASRAIPYIVIGYFLKTVVADNMSGIVTASLAHVSAHSGLELFVVVNCAQFEIYGDFAGYTYIAMGVSMLFGIRLPQNFRFPLLAQSIKEFWTRWHISLTAWFREYFYFSLVSRRTSATRIKVAIVFTFVVSGFWHGATWTCVIWGFLNGLGYFVPPLFPTQNALGRLANRIVIRAASLVTWLFFRARTVPDAFLVIHRIATNFWPAPATGEPGLAEIWHTYWWRVVLMAAVTLFEIVQRNAQDLPQLYRWPAPTRYAFYATVAVVYFYRGNFARIPFIYFQF